MKNKNTSFVLATVVLALALPLAAAPASDPMWLLPPGSRHVFQSAPPNWTAKIEFLRPQSIYYQSLTPAGSKSGSSTTQFQDLSLQPDDSFIVVQAPVAPNPRTDWKEVSYFDNAKEADPNKFSKVLRFRPDGTLADEIDRTSTEQFDRDFYRDGSVAFYEHIRNGQWLAAYSLSPDKKTVSHFANGSGDIVKWNGKMGNFTRTYYHEGSAYLRKRFEAGQPIKTELFGSKSDSLRVSAVAEELDLTSQHEYWHKDVGKPVHAQVMDSYINGNDGSVHQYNFSDDEVKKHIRSLYGEAELAVTRQSRAAEEQKRQANQQQLEADYLLRRSEFLSSYEQVVKAAGQSWHTLELERLVSPPTS